MDVPSSQASVFLKGEISATVCFHEPHILILIILCRESFNRSEWIWKSCWFNKWCVWKNVFKDESSMVASFYLNFLLKISIFKVLRTKINSNSNYLLFSCIVFKVLKKIFLWIEYLYAYFIYVHRMKCYMNIKLRNNFLIITNSYSRCLGFVSQKIPYHKFLEWTIKYIPKILAIQSFIILMIQN